jgi:hypothetical protein
MSVIIDGSAGVTTNTGAVYNSIQSGTSVTASGTSVDFTSIPSWVNRVTVMFRNISTNGSSLVQVQLGSGSVTSSGYNSSAYTNTTRTSTGSALLIDGQGNALYIRSGMMTISNMGSNIWVCSGSWSDVTNGNITYFGGGSSALSGTLDRIRITTVNGTDTFDAGSINILYE